MPGGGPVGGVTRLRRGGTPVWMRGLPFYNPHRWCPPGVGLECFEKEAPLPHPFTPTLGVKHHRGKKSTTEPICSLVTVHS